MKHVLLIAYHFPPMSGSSGILRALKYAQYLPALGWTPLVLTSAPRAYERTSDDQMSGIPETLVVRRAFALDAARHLSMAGHYPGWFAVPDRWSSWVLGALPAGLSMIRKYRPRALWSTFPIATAHVIGLALTRLTGVPWIADFRDPMAQEGYPSDPRRWRAYKWIETQAARHASRLLFTTPGALRVYRERYPETPSDRFLVNENGYDEESFATAATQPAPAMRGRKIALLHSGIVYPSERDPNALFAAIAALLAQGSLARDDFELVLRATGHDEHLARLIEHHGIVDVVRLAPPLPYRAALAEMLTADGLVIMQASNCNDQIPAKLYEYLRARRPILGLTDLTGDTAAALRTAGISAIAPLDSAAAIAEQLMRFVDRIRGNCATIATEASIAASSRRARAAELAHVLDSLPRR